MLWSADCPPFHAFSRKAEGKRRRRIRSPRIAAYPNWIDLCCSLQTGEGAVCTPSPCVGCASASACLPLIVERSNIGPGFVPFVCFCPVLSASISFADSLQDSLESLSVWHESEPATCAARANIGRRIGPARRSSPETRQG